MAAANDLLRKINSLDPNIFNIDYKDIENMKQIGGGNFGQVSKGNYFGTEVAIKQLLDVDDKDMHKYIEREMATLREMRHPNVVQFMGLSRNMTNMYIVTEYIPGGDLRKLLKDESKPLSWLLRSKIATDVAYAMTFLHSKGLIHRDLKSNNLLVGENWKIKVCDFGFSRRVNKGELMTLCGTDEWMAPEVMCGDKYDEKADVFSFGMVLTELVTRKKPPLRKPANSFAFEAGPFRQSLGSSDCPPELVDLTCLCSEQLPESRPHFKDVLPKLKALVTKLEIEEQEKKKREAAAAAANPASSAAAKKHVHKKKTTDKNETPEEKAKRREERKKKKEEKAAAAGKTVEEYDREKKEKKKRKEEAAKAKA